MLWTPGLSRALCAVEKETEASNKRAYTIEFERAMFVAKEIHYQ